ncbi:transglutaminase-like cysteine peptidase [Notoacmeibacter ruber]|uniref:Transglutaminase n=1 Tax=Notoacmeibacter ruber TaxID=2670375 RepID=A0A3L7JBG4_9HYPH|nr:transglutaminase-like cysteine peptidase [Notoacmeibacter ruber]RLQ86861.1 transglutaminase [Notoacmeibacter ruber]
MGKGTGLLAGLAAALAITVTGGMGAAASSNMWTGQTTSQPIGHYEFCLVNPAECDIRGRDNGPFVLTNSMWQRVDTINRQVNNAIEPINDSDLYGREELWTFPQGAGDCEDYVLEKQRSLAAAGVPYSDLLITVVRKPDGEGHAVLTFRTDHGDFILDNLNDDVLSWAQTPYRFLKRQSSTDSGRWVSLRSGNEVVVGSVESAR